MIRYRALQWPKDRKSLERLDVAFTTELIYRVVSAPHAFVLEAAPMSPTLAKGYAVAWEELQGAAAATVAEGGDSLLGVGAISYDSWNRRAVISHLYVDGAVRNAGVGTRLITELRLAAQAITEVGRGRSRTFVLAGAQDEGPGRDPGNDLSLRALWLSRVVRAARGSLTLGRTEALQKGLALTIPTYPTGYHSLPHWIAPSLPTILRRTPVWPA